VTVNRLVRVFQKCGSTLDRVIGHIIAAAARLRIFSSVAATSDRRSVTFERQNGSQENWSRKMSGIKQFDAADYLDSEEVIAEYLNAALEDPNPDVFLMAISDVAKARGMSKLAKDAGLGRESLYKALSPGAKPRYDTILKLLRGLGVDPRISGQGLILRLLRSF